MKRSFYLSAAVVAMMAASCQNDELINNDNYTEGQQFEITLNKGVESRTTLGPSKQTFWSAGDKILVTSEDGTVTGELELIQGQGTSSGKFRGTIKGGHPSNLKHIVFPAPVNGKINMSGRDEGQLDAPMLGEIPTSSNTPVTMNNVGGLLAVMIDGAGSNGLKLKTEATIDTQKKNMTGGYYTFDAGTGKLQYTSVDNPVPVLTSEDGYAYIPVATTTQPTDGKEESTSQTVSVNVEVSNANRVVVCTEEPVTVTKGKILGDESGENTGLNVNVDIDGDATPISVIYNSNDLTTAVSKGGDIKLNADLELSESLVITKETTIDLAGYSIKDIADGFTGDALIIVDRGGNLTIKDSSDGKGMIWANTISVGIKMTQNNETEEKASLTVDGGTIKAYDIAVSGNGLRHNTEITINGGVFETIAEESVAIYHPQDGTLTINGGLFDADWAAVEMRAGTLAINGGEFIARYRPTSGVQDGSGSTIHGAAIAVSQHSTHKPITVNITDGTFVGHSAFHEEYFEGGNYTGFVADGCSFNIAGGKFIGNVTAVP